MFSIFSRKKPILQTSLLQGMTDLHCHLLPGVDDGVQTEEEALHAFGALLEMGVTRFFLTPHVMEDMSQNNRSFLEERFAMLAGKLPAGIEVKLAAEYMLDTVFASHLKEGLLTMGDRHVLVETSYLSAPPEMQSMLYDLVVSGYSPIIAHPERYIYMEQQMYAALKEKGCRFQLNLLSLSGYYGGRAYEHAHYLLKNNLYDFVGSDFHNLEKHRKGLSHLSVGANQIKELQRLLENNQVLYGTS